MPESSSPGATGSAAAATASVLSIATEADARAAVERAFDFRGDVTLTTRDGRTLIGYVCNRVAEGPAEAYLEYLPSDGGPVQRVRYRDLARIAFTGADAAAGRGWETWVRKYEERKRARAEGRATGDIEPQPPQLDG